MKKILSYLLLCVYATIMVKPVMPTVGDIFAHLLNYKEHMATVHKHNGKAHVHYEYIEAAKKQSRENAPYNNNTNKNSSAEEHMMMFTALVAVPPVSLQNYSNLLMQRIPPISLQDDIRPPIAAFA